MRLTFGFISLALSMGMACTTALANGPDAVVLEEGKELFLSKAVPACAVCHTLNDAGSSGAIGPDLDELKPSLEAVKNAVHDGVGVMPSFASSLSEEQIDAVANYVVHATQ